MPSPKSQSRLSREVVRLILEERERLGLSKYALAAKSGVSQQMIGYVERGLRAPSFEVVLRLTESMGLDIGKLVQQARSRASRPEPSNG